MQRVRVGVSRWGTEQTPPPRRRVKEMEEVKLGLMAGVSIWFDRDCAYTCVPQLCHFRGRRLHLTTWDPQIANAPPFPQ